MCDARATGATAFLAALAALSGLGGEAAPATDVFRDRDEAAAMLLGYFEEMCTPKPFVCRTGDAFKAHQRQLRERLLACAGLWPLPERVPLTPQSSSPLDHEWCTVRRIAYRLWPGVYSTGLLYLPKQFAERPAPAVLCPHGHWANGNAHPEVQKRCLALARMGYVVFSSTQNHYEDPALGISHQTLMIWNNIRALDYLTSLPEADAGRIGCAGASGGGLQAQMIVALDGRIKAATIVGMTCDYREILFPGSHHCGCNHFPNIMRHTDEPELSALGLPAAVQYLTMNDWTRTFAQNNFPAVRRLYEANGMADRVECHYWPTGHSYDKPKRERTYAWMEKWLRGRDPGGPVPEPEVTTFPVHALTGLKAPMPGNKGFGEISRLVAKRIGYAVPELSSREQWATWRDGMRAALGELLGKPLPRRDILRSMGTEVRDGLSLQRLACPSEGDILVPALLLRPSEAKGKLPVVVICDSRGKGELLAATGQDSPSELARRGALVVLSDVRFTGETALASFAGRTGHFLKFKLCSPGGEGEPKSFPAVWQRNAMLWGRPLPAMAVTDIQAVLDAVLARPDADPASVTLIGRGDVAVAALFAAALDPRIAAADINLASKCFRARTLPLVPFVLQHGDVLEFAALLADRRLRLAGVAEAAGAPQWLENVFKSVGNADGLSIRPLTAGR